MSYKIIRTIAISIISLNLCIITMLGSFPPTTSEGSLIGPGAVLDDIWDDIQNIVSGNPDNNNSGNSNTSQRNPMLHGEVPSRNEVKSILDNNFLSRTQATYENINGQTVDVYTFYRAGGESQNNPNFSQILMVKQCLDYKLAHPDEDVKIVIASFHFSVVLAACLDENSPEYGHLKNLYEQDYDEETGYYRLAYLLGEAAKWGVEVTALAHLHANPVKINANQSRSDIMFEDYYYPLLEEPAYIEGKKVGDFMTAKKFEWTSYGDQAATDMMHLKVCAVSHYIDSDGVEHKNGAVWTGSTNIDGVNYLGKNGNDSIQTSMIVSGHFDLYRVAYNYCRLIAQYSRQQESTVFRDLVSKMATEQIALILNGRGHEIPADEQIVYVGTEDDSVFELYFTPLGGDANRWDTQNNPYCKYLQNILPQVSGEAYIELFWNNVKYKQSNDLLDTFLEVIAYSFLENPNVENYLQLCLPGMDTSGFADLKQGSNIGKLKIIDRGVGYHTKDLQLSYSIGGERHYVTLYNSLNMHEGSMSYQVNTILVIHETVATGSQLYTEYAIMMAQ